MQKPGTILKLYMTSSEWFTKLMTFLHAGFNGLWLGLLSREDLHQYDQIYYEKMNMYQNDAYNLSGLFEWEKECIKNYFRNVKTILLLGAGGGREVIALHRLGFQVDAYECNPRLVESANAFLERQNVPTRVSISSRDCVPQTSKIYDAIILGWGMYMLIQNSSRRVVLLKQLRQQCNSGSPVLLSFFSRKNNPFRFRFTAQIGNVIRRLLRRERIEIGDDLQPDFVHFFMEQEIASELGAGGFHMVYFNTDEYGHAVGFARDPA